MRRGVSAAPRCPWRLRRAPAGRPTTLTSSGFTGRATPPRAAPSLGARQAALRRFARPYQKAAQRAEDAPPGRGRARYHRHTTLRPAHAPTHRPLRDAHCAQASPPHAAREGSTRAVFKHRVAGASALPESPDAPRSTARGAAPSLAPGILRRAATGWGCDACIFCWAK